MEKKIKQFKVLREKVKNVPVGYRLCNQGHSGSRSIVVEKYTLEIWSDQELAAGGRMAEKRQSAYEHIRGLWFKHITENRGVQTYVPKSYGRIRNMHESEHSSEVYMCALESYCQSITHMS